MSNFLTPPAFKPEQTGPEADAKYRRLRWQVFFGIFIGYAGFYIVRKNFSMAIPALAPFGFDKGELGIVLSMNAIAYGFSKFLMASISDRSDARKFLPLGLVCAALSMLFMIVPVQWIGSEHKGLAITLMAALNFLVGWFNGMGWPPCGRVMTHWFSIKERGTWMSFWNCAHNVGGALVGPMAVYGAMWFGSWFYGSNQDYYFLIGTYAFPAAVAILVAVLAYCLIRDTPQSCGLPSIEKWSGHASQSYSAKAEEVSPSLSPSLSVSLAPIMAALSLSTNAIRWSMWLLTPSTPAFRLIVLNRGFKLGIPSNVASGTRKSLLLSTASLTAMTSGPKAAFTMGCDSTLRTSSR